MPPPDAADGAARLRTALERLIGAEALATARFGIAVSGGPDSLALLLLAAKALPGQIAAATVDHRLRAAAADEARHCADIAATLGVPHRILTPDAPPQPPNQAGARALRYHLLEQWRQDEALDWLLTAHHSDDQAETLLMRLNRGSGVAGLAGIRARNGHILRPLLEWRRDALADVVARYGLTAIDDPANRDPRHDRSRLRAALADSPWLDVAGVAGSAHHLADAEEALEWATKQLADERIADDAGGLTINVADLPAELLRRLLRTAIARLMPDAAPRGAEISRLIESARSGGVATLAGVQLDGRREATAQWRLRRVQPPRPR